MLSLASSVRIWLCLRPADMRQSFDGLAAMTRQVLLQDPLASGHLFVFVSRRADRLKALWWGGDGYALFYKRLERGTFRLPVGGHGLPSGEGEAVVLSPAELAMLLEGIELPAGRSPLRRQSFGASATSAGEGLAGTRRRKRLTVKNNRYFH
jgi:transposase